MAYYVYIMASAGGVLYIGVTNDIHRRTAEHKEAGKNSFADRYNCRKLLHVETYAQVTQAIAREKQLKGWRRAKKTELINSANQGGLDLSRYP